MVKAIRNLKNKKVASPGGLQNETIKTFEISLVKPLTKLFNQMLHDGLIPKQWLISVIILLYKKGNRFDLNNYHPISPPSNMCKIFTKLLKERLFGILICVYICEHCVCEHVWKIYFSTNFQRTRGK